MILSFLLAACSWVQSEEQPLTLEDLWDSDVERVSGVKGYTDGPAWFDGMFYFADRRHQNVHMVEPDGTETIILTDAAEPQGMAFDSAGNMYLCQRLMRRVVRITADGTLEVIAEKYDGKRLNSPNDLVLDDHGGLYFSDPRYGPMENVEQSSTKRPYLMAVYYWSPEDGKVTRVLDNLDRPDGIAMSPDAKTLYVAHPWNERLFAYPVLGPGQLGKGRTVFQGLGEKDGEVFDGSGPDGLTVDELGNIYMCFFEIIVVQPDGAVLGRITIPERPSNCAFGGEDGRTLFVTARNGVYKTAMKVGGILSRDPAKGAGDKPAATDAAAKEGR